MKKIVLDEVLNSPHKYYMTSDDVEAVYVMHKKTGEVFMLTHKAYEIIDYVLDFIGIDYEFDNEEIMGIVYEDY